MDKYSARGNLRNINSLHGLRNQNVEHLKIRRVGEWAQWESHP